MGDYDKAIKFFQKSRTQQAALKEQNGVVKATYFLAKTNFMRQNFIEAQTQIEEALAMVENQRADLNSQDLRLAFFSARRDYYELYLDILLCLHQQNPKANYDLSALEISERSKARNLFEILSGKGGNTNVNERVEVLRANQIKQNLDENTVLLEYTLGKDSSFLFAVTKEKVLFSHLPKSSEIEHLVQEIRQSLSESGRRNYARFIIVSRKLYETLLQPAENELKGKKNLIIAPDAALNYLPFEVLLTADPQRTGRAEFQTLSYALKNWTISYTPSASVLASIRERKATNRDYGSNQTFHNPKSEIQKPKSLDFIAFGDPVYGETNGRVSSRVRRFVREAFNSSSPPRLADSNREVVQIAAKFGDTSRVFLRQSATEENVKQNRELQSARIVHFATHGISNERLPQFSGLLLSLDATAKEDGLLQTQEIYDLRLDAELVVLSACRTALGKNLHGEGVIGLTRAFLSAGTDSVAATLWQVEDTSTADLMIDFYSRLTTEPNKAVALRDAKLNMMKNERQSHPHFWASFVLIGKQ